jgi:hypothetical protein
LLLARRVRGGVFLILPFLLLDFDDATLLVSVSLSSSLSLSSLDAADDRRRLASIASVSDATAKAVFTRFRVDERTPDDDDVVATGDCCACDDDDTADANGDVDDTDVFFFGAALFRRPLRLLSVFSSLSLSLSATALANTPVVAADCFSFLLFGTDNDTDAAGATDDDDDGTATIGNFCSSSSTSIASSLTAFLISSVYSAYATSLSAIYDT